MKAIKELSVLRGKRSWNLSSLFLIGWTQRTQPEWCVWADRMRLVKKNWKGEMILMQDSQDSEKESSKAKAWVVVKENSNDKSEHSYFWRKEWSVCLSLTLPSWSHYPEDKGIFCALELLSSPRKWFCMLKGNQNWTHMICYPPFHNPQEYARGKARVARWCVASGGKICLIFLVLVLEVNHWMQEPRHW